MPQTDLIIFIFVCKTICSLKCFISKQSIKRKALSLKEITGEPFQTIFCYTIK